MHSSRFRIATRLTAGFAVVLLLTVIMAVMAGRTMLAMAEMASDLYAHPFAVTNALMRIEAQVNGMRSDMLEMIHHRSYAEVGRLSGQVAIKENELAASMAVVRSQYLGDPEDVKRLSERLAEWKMIRDQNIRYCQNGDFDLAAQHSRQHAALQVHALRRDLEAIYAFAMDKAAQFHRKIGERRDQALRDIAATLAGLLILGAVLARLITRSIVAPLGQLRDTMHQLAEGNLEVPVPDQSRVVEVAKMAATVEIFKQAARHLESQRWIKDNVARLSQILQQSDSIAEFASASLDTLVPLMGARVAAFHIRPSASGRFVLAAGWGLAPTDSASFALGEGVAGEAARGGTPLLVDSLPRTWLRIASATGEAAPNTVLAAPVMSRGTALAVIEFASLAPFTEDQQALIEATLPVIALNLEILERNIRTRDLLEETQTQAEELKASEEELRSQGEALQVINEELRVSEEELKVQQEALQAANEELRLKSDALEERGLALEEARAETDRRAQDVERASRYKSEFLANMSHELRTPLNSVLILARDLADNETGNLSGDQVESARVIHDSGTHLLSLINDVLDLSKVEAGKMTLAPVSIPIAGLAQGIRGRFAPVAADKGLAFQVEMSPDLPETLTADRGKIEQIVNNLVSNAIKFTAEGSVTVHLAGGRDGVLALSVTDTGIGIDGQDRQRIFAAFEQADSGSSRQFGGTGLGLTISRRLARLMGGDITLESTPGKGSVFTLLLPLDGVVPLPVPPCAPEPPPPAAKPPPAAILLPEIDTVTGSRQLLVIEDDPVFRRVVAEMARAKGFAVITAENGRTGLDLARLHRPGGIVLDIGLPDMSGWEVIETLNRTPETRGIPVHVISAGDDPARAARLGIAGHLTKPVSREQINEAFEVLLRAGASTGLRRLLLVDGDEASRTTIGKTLTGMNLDITIAETGGKALEHLRGRGFDCMILDLTLPDMQGAEFLEQAERIGTGLPPVIVYSSEELSQDQTLRIREFTDSIVIKGSRSSERLVDEVGLFLHAIEARKNGRAKPCAAASTEPGDAVLAGRTVLLVDDDMRNAFALSKVLRGRGLKVLIAQDGAKALSQLRTRGHVDLVLMDIMMPGMDGYQTMGEIRKDPSLAHLPIVALTAKAMAGDRDRCLAAGADDYLTKPVDMALLCRAMAALIQRGPHAEPS